MCIRDRLQTAYCCIIGIYLAGGFLYNETVELKVVIGFILPLLLHVAELFVEPPAKLPDLFPVLWSVFGCAGLGLSYLYTVHQLFSSATTAKAKRQ